jgi:hypothetical protein
MYLYKLLNILNRTDKANYECISSNNKYLIIILIVVVAIAIVTVAIAALPVAIIITMIKD